MVVDSIWLSFIALLLLWLRQHYPLKAISGNVKRAHQKETKIGGGGCWVLIVIYLRYTAGQRRYGDRKGTRENVKNVAKEASMTEKRLELEAAEVCEGELE